MPYATFRDGALNGLGVGAGVRYVGSSYAVMETVSGAQVSVPGYTLVDAALNQPTYFRSARGLMLVSSS